MPESSALLPVRRGRAETTHALLREEILTFKRLAGTRLAEATVAKELQVSRVPVREALVALEQEGLIEFGPTGRAHVKTLSAEDFEELYVLRLLLEPIAAKRAMNNLKNNLSKLHENIRQTRNAASLEQLTRLDLDFHEMLMQASGQRRMARLWQSLRSELELWLAHLHRTHHGETSRTREQTADAHEKILRMLSENSPDEIEQEIRQHIIGWRKWLPSENDSSLKD